MSVTQMPEHITADCIVQGVIDRYPQTIVVFARHGMPCVGCYIAPFHTVADSAREHAVTLESFLDHLNRALMERSVARQDTAW